MQAKAPRFQQPKIIERPRLTKQLDECGARIILLVAPAGYGKTTLARQWLANKPHAWCSLSRASRDVAALALGIAMGARAVVADAGGRMQKRLAISSRPSTEVAVFVEMLADDLARWPDAAWLAVDDYQAISGAGECETFVQGLLDAAPIRLVITSRTRPAWANPRSRAYGLHYEIDRDTLAMTDEEAAQILPHREALELAKGWPAVVGLASALESVEPRTELADSSALHSFLTEELLRNAPPKVQRSLFRLSLCPDMTIEQARAVLGVGRVSSLVDRSARVGLLSVREGTIAMHPLVRQFVRDRHRERDLSWRDEMRLVARALMKHELWDAAYSLIDDLGDRSLLDRSLLDELLAVALEPMLQAGRHGTVEAWIKNRTVGNAKQSPWVLLTEAELAFRQGDQQTAATLAVQSAQLAEDPRLTTRAWNLAGRTAHLSDRYSEALEYHRRAYDLASTEPERYDAVWGQLVASWQVDPSVAASLVPRLHSHADASIDSQLRLIIATLHDGLQQGRMWALEDRVRAGLVLAPRAANPVTAASFLINAGRWFTMTAHYEEALGVVEQIMMLASEHRLSFVLPSALNVRALACVGLRKWGAATRALDACQTHAEAFDDIHNRVEIDIIRMHLHLARGETQKALELTGARWNRDPGPLELLEYVAVCALVDAIAGGSSAAARIQPDIIPNAEIVTITLATKAVESIKAQQKRRAINALCEHVAASGCLTGFVSAYRAFPDLLAHSAEVGDFLDFIRPVVQRARDTRLAKRVGIQIEPTQKTHLTKREREVHELLAQGLTNREIARLLYVEEVTVKVHVRHILDKLGVRSRVEAATRTAAD